MKISRLLDKNKNSEDKTDLPDEGDREDVVLEQKIQEIISLIEVTRVSNEASKTYQKRISEAFKKSVLIQKEVAPYNELDQDSNLSREELLENLEKLLMENKIDSRVGQNVQRKSAMQKVSMFIFAVLLIVLGFAMIIMPAPASFEMFTIFYISANDGVTIMDLVSLLIIFGGVLLFVLNFNKK